MRNKNPVFCTAKLLKGATYSTISVYNLSYFIVLPCLQQLIKNLIFSNFHYKKKCLNLIVFEIFAIESYNALSQEILTYPLFLFIFPFCMLFILVDIFLFRHSHFYVMFVGKHQIIVINENMVLVLYVEE